MTGEQIQAAREAAKIIVVFGPHDDDGNISPAYVACERFLWLTDPTPLTWELVVAEGFTQIAGAPAGAVSRRCGNVTMQCWPEFTNQVEHRLGRAIWEMARNDDISIIQPSPSTHGELRQLMLRVGGDQCPSE